ncbi:DUF7660 family protein [Agromyces bracchium]|uniref:DUF7660 domain-containing protein n=1 Tax=Agromyces bracchium TaxID=88376 RepID=A0A6I3MAH7_9MICO|nr:hypothetical protein [Agromyces bracchium]MTH68356.1 hypothetical protein [Agromyces bracchium]
MDLDSQALNMSSRADLVEFLGGLADSFATHPERWQNANLPDFLNAWAAWLEDMDGYFQNRGESVPTSASWQLIAQMLLAARVYE